MKLAAKQAELAACPHVSEEAKEQLAAAAAPPIRLITIGSDEKKVAVGNETVMFRHEKTFFHQPGLFVRISDSQPEEEYAAVVDAVHGYSVERVGMTLNFDGIAIENTSGDAQAFADCAAAVRKSTDGPLILMSQSAEAVEAVLDSQIGDSVPLVYAADADNYQAMAELALKHDVPLAVRADDLDSLASLVKEIQETGVKDIVLDPGARGMADSLAALTKLRRLALKKNFRLLGFPVITFPGDGAEDTQDEALLAAQHIAKYAGFIVLDHFEPATAYPLLTLRQNIYTDPQKPIQVSPGLYEINDPTPESPLLVSTNFSLTYFSVAGEVENSASPCWLLIADAEGMSVLTAWAAGKFDAERIAKSVNTMGVPEKVGHKKIVIPGFVATISGDLEEELPGWEILVGPREAIDIPAYLKQWR
jgi:acetyl-CoA decarbonylase/synthase complex subunit gamma